MGLKGRSYASVREKERRGLFVGGVALKPDFGQGGNSIGRPRGSESHIPGETHGEQRQGSTERRAGLGNVTLSCSKGL